MANLLEKICYSKTWTEDYRDSFTEEELALIKRIVIVPGDYGLSARIEMEDKDTYYSIHKDSKELAVDEELDPKKCIIIHLKRGEATCDKLLYQE